MRILLLLLSTLFLFSCASYKYPPQIELGKTIIAFEGESLDGVPVSFPRDIAGKPVLLIFGYVQDSQFDIDRWLIGLDMTKTTIDIIEVPAIQSFFAGLAAPFIDEGMRSGIPRELWSIVVTVYDDGDKVQRYTGNKKPRNARIVLVDEAGVVRHFYDSGFSVNALNELRDKISAID